MRKKKETIKSLTATFETWRLAAKDFMYQLQHPVSRRILGVNAADAQGKLNGMTIVELLAITNLLSTTGEKLYLVPGPTKNLLGYAVKDPGPAPFILLQ